MATSDAISIDVANAQPPPPTHLPTVIARSAAVAGLDPAKQARANSAPRRDQADNACRRTNSPRPPAPRNDSIHRPIRPNRNTSRISPAHYRV